ncbi:hypothetical protein [Gluconacetobacter diazotrophicus]|uniref:hypothetical protein n=1 Tax=Gluconacetobacter diazotrophicus TaxID=33996 RepID=UPI0021800EE8|nr:hypothetical protein [Gluconacetobacter diazotrophicus]
MAINPSSVSLPPEIVRLPVPLMLPENVSPASLSNNAPSRVPDPDPERDPIVPPLDVTVNVFGVVRVPSTRPPSMITVPFASGPPTLPVT